MTEQTEKKIEDFGIWESIDYVIKAFDDGNYQTAYKNYLIAVMRHIESSLKKEIR